MINYSTHGDTDVALKLLLLQWPPGELLTIPAFDVMWRACVDKMRFENGFALFASVYVENVTTDLL